MRSFGRVALFLGLWVCFLVAEKNASTLGLESFLGGEAGEAGEIELAKIRIANLLAQKAELEREAAELEAKRKERAANLVSADDPEVIALLKQIDELKAQIAKLKAENAVENSSENASAENSAENASSAITKNPAEIQGEYIK
ncbi:MAG: hypothetical protein SPJ69_04330 [Campylobacter sp.]|uniref:hypothetical protein n=1 Tax=Campylobacter sp. TaxID=205 RepID=UPI0029728EB2|nr:hypothetical protein [Campylobacter sp.]MDD7600388.1 hypothetical protein [Campylobacteraceae bacterium]MDY5887528.1 hypothetical protein [Campylobacter sp.]